MKANFLCSSAICIYIYLRFIDVEITASKEIFKALNREWSCFLLFNLINRVLYLRNEFYFWNVHGIMNTAGIL